MVSSSICGSWAAHSGWMLATAPSSANLGMSSGWTTCRWARWCRPSSGRCRAGRLDGVERFADGTVAERVEVHLEAGGVELGHVLAQGVRVDEAEAAVGRRAAAGVEVGIEHPGGEVLGDAVLHDLHRRRPETAVVAARAPLDELVDLLGAPLAVPPQGCDHSGSERTRLAALTARVVAAL